MTDQIIVETQQPAAVAYEYSKVRVPQQLEHLYRDAYLGFGWTVESAYVRPAIRPLPLLPAIRSNKVTLTLKRDRQLRNRPMVQELQRKAETSLAAIARMEKASKTTAVAIAVTLGLAGAVLLGLSMFSMGATIGFTSILFGGFGLATWVAGLISYFTVKHVRAAHLRPLIDKEQDNLFDAVEQANRLLH